MNTLLELITSDLQVITTETRTNYGSTLFYHKFTQSIYLLNKLSVHFFCHQVQLHHVIALSHPMKNVKITVECNGCL